MSRSSRSTLPLDSFSIPVIRLITVVFPAPFGPIKPVIRPDSAVRETRFTAVSPPNDRVTSRSSSRITNHLQVAAARTQSAPCMNPERIDDAVRQIDHDDDEQRPVHNHSILCERAG